MLLSLGWAVPLTGGGGALAICRQSVMVPKLRVRCRAALQVSRR
jgi:hypothetical protein